MKKYTYELWTGRKVVGKVTLPHPIRGETYVIQQDPEYTTVHGLRAKTICVPIVHRVVSDDGVDVTIRTCLDVRKKTQRQREVILREI